MSKPRIFGVDRRVPTRLCVAAIVLTATIALGGCASTLESLPTELGGLPNGTPERPAVQPEYPGVFNTPPSRSTAVLTDDEVKKAQTELAAARDRQNQQAADAKSN